MKRIAIGAVSILLVTILVLGVSTAMAAKPQDVIERSNGFPSGAHFNLNIHGKKDGYTGDSTPGGKSVFVGLSGNSTIEYVSNKKASLEELRVLDPLAECFDNDPAKVQLPAEEEGYYVFARILGQPNNGSGGSASSIFLYPNIVVQTCNATDSETAFGDLTECPGDPDLALGLITSRNLYIAEPEGFVRFADSTETKGKGKSKARDITPLFTWTGYVSDDATLDTNEDGVIDESDVPIEYDLIINGGNENSVIDEVELINWLDDQVAAGNVIKYVDEWIFNIADLVVTNQTVVNDGTKLLQIRFYPVATTEFIQ